MSSLSLSHTLSPWMDKWWRERCMYAANKQRGGGHLGMHAPSTPGFMSKEVHASCTPGCMPTKEGACTLKTLSLLPTRCTGSKVRGSSSHKHM